MEKPDLDLHLLYRAEQVSDGNTVHRLAALVGIYKNEYRRYDGWEKLHFPAPYTQRAVIDAIKEAERNLRSFLNAIPTAAPSPLTAGSEATSAQARSSDE